MKKSLFILAFIIIGLVQTGCKEVGKTSSNNQLPVGDTSRNALDWQGTYFGILPCADCEGIETVIRLAYDNTYVMQTKYLGKDEQVIETRGSFTWNEAGSKITLDQAEGASVSGHYQVGENQLFHLDLEGNRITGELAANYVLPKVTESLSGRTWRLIEVKGTPFEMKDAYFHIPILIFNEEEGRFAGNAGCNNLMGSYELNDSNGIRMSEVASTLMACPDMELEQTFLELVKSVETYQLGWDTLSLSGKKDAPLLRYAADYLLKVQ
ncbi:MAG: copper resistance protein NlpE N-terminal domain-containing protein [Bacteroides sp.]|jgi:heat shock protein HslJ|nr:copper resistance protein NlpE N-terminal domain-containing protein [Bacteroides sp.]